MHHDIIVVVLSWPRSYGKFILYLYNHCLSTLQGLNSISVHGVIYSIQQCIRKYIRVCLFSLGTPNDIIEVVFKMAFNN